MTNILTFRCRFWLTTLMAIAVLLLAMTSHSRENLPDTASWQDIFSEYDANGYPDWTGESPEGAVGFFGVALEVSGEEAAGTIAPDIVPVPWCLDVNGCIDPDASWEEQRMQNEEQWRDFCDCSVPDAYGHTGHGDNARTYIVYGDYITVYRPDGTLGDVS